MISMLEAVPKQCPKHSGKQCKLSNARTYGRTYRQLLTLVTNLTLGNARRGAARFAATGDRS